METMTVGAFKTKFSQVVEGVKKGKSYTVSYGKNKEKIAVIVPFNQYKTTPRKLGLLEGKAKITPAIDFKIDDNRLLNS